MEDQEIAERFPVMSVVILKLDLARSKIDKRATNICPFFVIAHCKTTRVTNLMELISGKIVRRSYRNLKNMLPSPEFLSSMTFPMWLNQHPLTMVNNVTIWTVRPPNEEVDDYKKALKHIAELYTFLSPILPTVKESKSGWLEKLVKF